MKTSIAILALLGAAVTAADAAAQPTTVAPVIVEPGASVRVPYGDLDLGGPMGLDALRGRVSAAADKLCGQRSRLLDVDAQRKACRKFALDSAEPQIAAARSAALAAGPREITLARR
jgi:UrcA family protein